MAARFWQCVLGCELAFVAAAAAALAMTESLSLTVTTLSAIGMLVCAVPLVLAGTFIFSFSTARSTHGRLSRCGLTLCALIIESVQFNLAVLAMSVAPCRRSIDVAPPSAGRVARPVLLVHGFLCNAGIWRPWIRKLQAAGFEPVRTIDLEPLFGDIDCYSDRVARELRDMQSECGGARVAVVAHSMGGLVARSALRGVGPSVISAIVTLASPHHGSRLACFLPWRLMQQMCPGSSWLRALNACCVTPSPVPLTCIFSIQDNLIVPARSAAMDGARLHELRGLGHMGVLASSRSIDCAIAALAHL